MKDRGYNFNPGPAVLPAAVLERGSRDLLNYRSSGMGVAEITHRGPLFEEIIESSSALLRELLGIPEGYSVLYCTGGATQQFSMVPMNLLPGGISGPGSGNYILSDVWGEHAAEEAKKFGRVHVAASTKEQGYREIPAAITLSDDARYLHFTSNNTVVGTQFQSEPGYDAAEARGIPLICDASSDILSRPIPVERYGLIYAGAQKNLGPAGVTIVIIRNDLLKDIPEGLPLLMDYRTYAKSKSLHNTPPTLSIYFVREVLQWLKDEGGVHAVEKRNREKAKLVYERIDASSFYRGTVSENSRSVMNITFRLPDETLEKRFVDESAKAGLFGLKGHRLTGGIRASMYNALPLEAAKALVAFMGDFEATHG